MCLRNTFSVIVMLIIGSLAVGKVASAQANDVDCDKCINTADIAGGAVTTAKLRKSAVTTNKISDKAVTANKIAGGAIRTGKIKNGAVTMQKLSPNVQDLVNGSIGGIILEQVVAIDGSGVVGQPCPANSLVGSASCSCDGDGVGSNFGVLFACRVAGNGGVGGCYPEAGTFNPMLPASPASITLVCASAVQNDGTPITPVPLRDNLSGVSALESGDAEYETAVENTRRLVSDRWASMRNR